MSLKSMGRVNKKWDNSILLYMFRPSPYYVYFKAYIKITWKFGDNLPYLAEIMAFI